MQEFIFNFSKKDRLFAKNAEKACVFVQNDTKNRSKIFSKIIFPKKGAA